MWNEAEFKKATGVTPNATPEEMAKALTAALKKAADAGIGQALLAFKLKDLGWKSTEAQQAYGFNSTSYAVAAQRGAILWACGPKEAHRTWLHAVALGTSDGILTDTYNALLGIQEATDEEGKKVSAEENRRAHMTRSGRRRLIAARLGEKATNERVDAMDAAMDAEKIDMPRSIRDAIPAMAKRLEIPLPEVKRQTKAADKQADATPTTAAAKAMLEAVQVDRLAADAPEAYRPEEVADLQAIMARAARMLVAGKHLTAYQVADFVAQHLDEVAAIKAPLPEMQTGTVA